MTVIGIDCDVLEKLGEDWGDDGLWDDILWLADRAWGATHEVERRVTWHHLVMAVGNFKRQTNRRLHPARLWEAKLTHAPRPTIFRVPDSERGFDLGIDDASSWRQLQILMRGAAAPTVTTLLASLWPEEHHILDWRVLAASAALTLGGPDDLWVSEDGYAEAAHPRTGALRKGA
jgi:hypothetical protein